MGEKKLCYVCKIPKGWKASYTLKDYWRSPETPEGMTRDDRVCLECYSKVKKEIMIYKKEHKTEIDHLDQEQDKHYKTMDQLEKEKQQWSEHLESQRRDCCHCRHDGGRARR